MIKIQHSHFILCMSNFPHDDFAKAYLVELLSTIGTATPNYPFKAETREADLWFQPNPEFEQERSQLGLLGRLLPKDTLIEVFRNPASPFEIGGCRNKRFSLEAEFVRKAKREKKPLTEPELPSLLLLMPTASQEIRDGFAVTPTETSGLYTFPRFDRSQLVVLHQLPKTKDTLWLRLLARAGEQRSAIEEFIQMPPEVPLNANIGELLADYRAMLESRRLPITQDEEELIMNLSAAYLQKREEWKEEGAQERVFKVANNLLRQGMSVELVAHATELPIEQVNQLRQQLT
jgi:hypothetical protein